MSQETLGLVFNGCMAVVLIALACLATVLFCAAAWGVYKEAKK